MTIEHLIGQYGLAGLFLGAGFEGETVTVIGGLMAHRGLLAFWPAVLAASAGSFVADQLFFMIGRRFRGHGLVRKAQAKPAFAKALATFERYPVAFTFAFRFLYGLRTVSPMAIGTTRLAASTFVAINVVAAAVWGLVFVSLGYWCGQAVEAMFGRIHALEPLIGGVVVVAALIGLGVHFVLKRREGG